MISSYVLICCFYVLNYVLCFSAQMNIGPVKTFILMKELNGSYDNVVHQSKIYKNFYKVLKAYIEGSDMQMFINNFQNKRLLWSTFFFFTMSWMQKIGYVENFGQCHICRKNYALFVKWYLLITHSKQTGDVLFCTVFLHVLIFICLCSI